MKPVPRLVALELTGRCNLSCVHCRASAADTVDPNELKTNEIYRLIDDIASFSKPILILSGGEPLVRDDIFDIAEYANKKGLRVVLATNATLINEEIAKKIKEVGIGRVSISIDGASEESHDTFRGYKGAFRSSLRGIEELKKAGVEFQINTTITKRNVHELEKIYQLAVKLGAKAFHVFLLVPTGRGEDLKGEELSKEEYEKVLNWMYEKMKEENSPFMKATCAPHFFRVVHQRASKEGLKVSDVLKSEHAFSRYTRGCLAGIGFAFISRYGEVNPCGYLPIKAGNIREESFKDIWFNSEVFNKLRDLNNLKGKCGICEFKRVCGGCRARAYALKGDYLEEEPYCIYVPRRKDRNL